MGKVADGWSFRLCCLRCLWAWRWCSASSCLLLGTTRLCGLVPACMVPRCLSSGEEEKERGLVAREPGTHGHSFDLAPPTVRMPQGTSSMPACWRHCWKRQDWRTPTCRTVPTGEAPGLDLASLWPQFPCRGSGQWSSRVPAASPIPAWNLGASTFQHPWEWGTHSPVLPCPRKLVPTALPHPPGHLSAHSPLSAGSRFLSFPPTWPRSWPVATGPWNLHPLPASAAGLVPASCCPTALPQLVAPHHPRC